jgi:hypothetical protein
MKTMKVKTRKQGNSITMTIPAIFQVEENIIYEIHQDENGNIFALPERENMFKHLSDGEYRKYMETDDYSPVGLENLN